MEKSRASGLEFQTLCLPATPPPLEGLGHEADQGWGEGTANKFMLYPRFSTTEAGACNRPPISPHSGFDWLRKSSDHPDPVPVRSQSLFSVEQPPRVGNEHPGQLKRKSGLRPIPEDANGMPSFDSGEFSGNPVFCSRTSFSGTSSIGTWPPIPNRLGEICKCSCQVVEYRAHARQFAQILMRDDPGIKPSNCEFRQDCA